MNERFQELFNKGWANLNSGERAEYSTLKAENDAGKFDVVKPSEKQVAMTEKQLNELIDSKMATLKMQNQMLVDDRKKFNRELGYGEWQEADVLNPRKHTAWLKLYAKNPDDEKGLVVFTKVHEYIRNPQTGTILNTIFKIKVWDSKEVKEYLLPMSEYASITDREQVDIINVDKKKLVKRHGKVKKSVVINGYAYTQGLSSLDVEKKDGGDWVDLKEEVSTEMVTIRRADGAEMQLDGKYLNN